MKVFQLKITLEGISPPIWRRVHVPATLRLDGLHRVVQAAMGWTNSHIHEFTFRDRTFSDPAFDEDGGLEIDDERDERLTHPVCVGGERACPPEDVGGVGGYWRILEVLANAGHPDRDETLAWIGGAFDPECFDVNLVNRALRGGE